jgi:ABC-type branched-subunit amino acid transport system permease subunit
LVETYGKYVLINHDDVRKTEEWFNKRGELTIFFARLIPVVRHLISLIAGIGKMDVKKFSLYTIIGASLLTFIPEWLRFLQGPWAMAIFGLALGAIYILLASGLSIIFGLLDVVNFTHGAFYMLGAYLAYTFMTILKINVPLSALMAVAGVAVIGIIIDYFGIRPLRDRHASCSF